VRFLVDRCAGRRLADWLRGQGYEVAEVVGPDPGDQELLDQANREERILITLDKHFLQLIFHRSRPHRGMVRLPDVPAAERISLLERVLATHAEDLARGAVISVRGERIRVSLARVADEM
jgi:predicted nuclease of predicted toxin-antitoxin system